MDERRTQRRGGLQNCYGGGGGGGGGCRRGAGGSVVPPALEACDRGGYGSEVRASDSRSTGRGVYESLTGAVGGFSFSRVDFLSTNVLDLHVP